MNIKLVVQGSNTFNDYAMFLRAMGVALSGLGSGDSITLYTLGPAVVNNHAVEFTNKTKQSLKGRGITLNLVRANVLMLDDPSEFDKFFYFRNNKEWLSKTGKDFRSAGVDVLAFPC